MPAGSIRTPNDPRTTEAGMLLIGAGAILLFVSLFLEWYQPGIDAWEIFEVWDLVLAVLAIVALVAVASRMGFGPPRPSSWLIGPALAVLVIVLYLLINPPPLTPNVDGDPSTGMWLALAAAALMTAGALLSVARISVAINPADSLGGGRGPGGAGRGDHLGHSGAAPAAGDRVDPSPVGPGPGPGPGGAGVGEPRPGPGGPGPGPGGPGPGPGGTTPTDPTRRI